MYKKFKLKNISKSIILFFKNKKKLAYSLFNMS